MSAGRLIGSIFGIFMLFVGIFCFRGVYLALSGIGPGGSPSVGLWAEPVWWGARVAVFLVAGLVCTVGAWRILGGAETRTSEPNAPLFGRQADAHPGPRPWSRPFFAAVALAALAILVADGMDFGRFLHQPAAVEQDADGEVAAAPDEAKAEPDTVAVDVPPPVATPSEPAPVAAAEQPIPQQSPALVEPAVVTAPEPAFTLPSEPPEIKPPEVALAPVPADPPTTVAPLPLPLPSPPTQPDGHRDAVVWLSVSPDGRSFMSASTDNAIKLWDSQDRHLIRDLGAHKDMARTALFMPDGERALTAGDDGEIVLRSIADGAVQHVFSAADHGRVTKIALSADGRRAVSGHENGSVIAWDIENRTVMHVLTGHDWSISGVAVSPDGSRALSGSIDGTLMLWDTSSGRLLRSWHGHERGAYGIQFTADGRRAVTGSGDLTIKLWDLDKAREVSRWEGHSGTVYALVLSADGKRILSGSLDGTARLWDMATGDELAMFTGHRGPVYAVAFAADGTILTGGKDRTIRAWPAAGGDAVALIPGAPD